MRLVALFAGASRVAAVGAALPLGRAMRADGPLASRAAALWVPSVSALVTVEVLLVGVLEVASQRVKGDACVLAGYGADLAAWNEVIAVEATLVCHVESILAEASAC